MGSDMGSADDWKDWRNVLVTELREIRKEQTNIRVEIAMLKVKSGLWGFAAGALPTFLILLKKSGG